MDTKSLIKKVLVGFFLGIISFGKAQNPDCDAATPYFYVDMTNNPAGVWSSPNISRAAHCCGVTGSDQCISLDVKLDSNACGIQIDMVGADPSGALFYKINCVGNYPGGTIKCISGAGLQHITFCKPGSNKNIYKVTSISKPFFPFDDTVRVGCTTQLKTFGILDNQTHWTSIYPGATGAFNSYLNCTNCASPVYTPAPTAPAYIEYQVCGFPQASLCGFNTVVCDTVRIYNLPSLSTSIGPINASFCDLGPGSGVTLITTGTGGQPPYAYTWRNSSNVIVGTGPTYFASQAGNYTVEVKDALYNSSSCPSFSKTIAVVKGNLPIVDAGADKKVCATSPSVSLNGTAQYATGGIWTGGTGIFNPGSTFLNTNYKPSSSEIIAGSVTLTLTSSGSGGSCINKSDQVTIFFSDSIKVNISTPPLKCFGDITTLTLNSTGGTAPLTYQWNDGSTSSTIDGGQGNYTAIVTDGIGCTGSKTFNLISPPPLTVSFSTLDVSTVGGNDGSATVIPGGGTPPYNFLWSNGSTTATINSLVYGAYSVIITDSKGCMISGSVVISEPPCIGFNVTATSTNILCYDAHNGMGVAIPSGGTPPFTYSWNDSLLQANDTAFNLSPGAYTITVHDVFNCIQMANISISQPQNLTNTMNHSDATIVGGNNGSATANPFGGTTPYTYSWSNGETTQAINNLTTGEYVVTITDNNECGIIDSIYINEPPCTSLTLNVVTTNVACFGGNTGSATTNVSNAVPPYIISWSNGQTGFVANNLAAGDYTVAITDAINCTRLLNFTITEPPLLSVSTSPNNIICHGFNNGTIDLAITGGTFPYSFSWSNGASTEDLINLAPGNYSVIVLDKHGCKVNASSQIIEPSAFAIFGVVTPTTCIYGSDGAIDLTVSGGTAPYVYSWSNGAATQDVSGLQAGGYEVTVTDANSCISFPPSFFAVKQPDSLTISSFTVACPQPGLGNAFVAVVPKGGNNGIYQVSFDNGSTFQTSGDYDTYLPNGENSYIIIKDSKSCLSILPDTIFVNPEVTINAVTFNNCFTLGTTTTLVTVNASGGDNGPYSVSYDNGSTFQNPGTMSFNLPVGREYRIIVKDAHDCQSLSTSIIIPDVLIVSVTSPTFAGGFNITCNGATSGTINLSVSGGLEEYAYSWTGPGTFTSTDQNPTGLDAGIYDVTVTDGNGCTRKTSITLTEPDVLTTAATSPTVAGGYNVTCNGNADGSVNLSVAGGTPPYSYAWTGPGIFYSILQNPSGLLAGNYSITVTDANGCTAFTSITLTQPSVLKATATSPTFIGGYNITCEGAMNGTINLAVTGGATAYSYAWTGPAAYSSVSQNPTGIGAGNYSVVVTDANGCLASSSITLIQPEVLTAVMNSPNTNGGYNITCNGYSNGSINLGVIGGTNPYSYSWTGPGTFTSVIQNPTGLAAGDYSVIITDVNGCTLTMSITLTEPPVLNALASVTSNFNGQQVSCFNKNDGSATVSAIGGTTPYSYSWSTIPLQSTATANGLGANTYIATIKDANSCTTSSTVTLTQPAPLASTASVISNYNGNNISCNGANDGSAWVLGTGGTLPYSYLWLTVPVKTNDTVFALGANNYMVTIFDANQCTSSANVTLTQPSPVMVNATSPIVPGGYNITCNGATNGSINLDVTGGSTAYSYSWTGPGSFSSINQNLIGVGAGNYSVIVTDANGCNISKSITLTQPDELLAVVNSPAVNGGYNVSCNGNANGSITLGVTGGTMAYSFIWSGPGSYISSAQNPTGLTAGSYSVNVSDANGCAINATISLTEPPLLTSIASVTSNYNGQQISCYNANDGSAIVSTTGGTPPYSYNWSTVPIQQTSTANNLSANSYAVTVTDANLCSTASMVTLTQPAPLTAGASVISDYSGQNISCYGANDGSASVLLTGGIAPFTYSWSTVPVQTNDTASVLGANTYVVSVSDANKCSASASVSLTQPALLTASAITSSWFNGYGISCKGLADGAIDLTVNGGVAAYHYNWSNAANTEDISNSRAGNYSVIVTDQNGCTALASAVLTEPEMLIVQLNSTSDYNGFEISCFGSSNGNIDIGVSGGVSGYQYFWSNGTTTQDQLNVMAGNYSVYIADGNNCNDTLSVTLSQPPPLKIIVDSASNYNGFGVSCNQSTDGWVNITMSGGVDPFYYMWSNGEVSQNLTGAGAGPYALTAIDVNNCLTEMDTVITEPTALMATYSSQNPACNTTNTGTIDLTVSGGVTPYSYHWDNGQSSEDLNNISTGTYEVIIADLNNCSDSLTIVLTDPQTLANTIEKHDVKCNGESNGIIYLFVDGGTMPYSYNWSDGSITQNNDSLSSGTYYVTVTDAHFCITTDTIVIDEPAPLTLTMTSPELPNGHNISYHNGNDGSIDLTVNGGVFPYAYLWSSNVANEDLQDLATGEYFVVVTDQNDCSTKGSILLTDPLSLEMPTGYTPNGDGINDYFVVHGIEAFPDNKITVFNRWGNIVYQKSNYLNEWAGKNNNGDELPATAYFVILEINNGDTVLKGYVEMKRN